MYSSYPAHTSAAGRAGRGSRGGAALGCTSVQHTSTRAGVRRATDWEAETIATRVRSSVRKDTDKGQFSRTVSRHTGERRQHIDSESPIRVGSPQDKRRPMHAAEAFAPMLASPRRAEARQHAHVQQLPAVGATTAAPAQQPQRRVNNRGSVAGCMGLPAMPLEVAAEEHSGRLSQSQSKSSSHEVMREYAVDVASETDDSVVHGSAADQQDMHSSRHAVASGTFLFHVWHARPVPLGVGVI